MKSALKVVKGARSPAKVKTLKEIEVAFETKSAGDMDLGPLSMESGTSSRRDGMSDVTNESELGGAKSAPWDTVPSVEFKR